MASQKPTPKRSVVITAQILALLVGLAGAEGLLKVAGYPVWWAMDPGWGGSSPDYETDPQLGWRVREGNRDLTMAGLGNFHATNWSGGRRATSPHAPGPDAANRPQVMFFGDSYIQGYALSDAQTLPWIVQEHHPGVLVSNFGAGNYGTYQSYLAMQKWVRGPATVYHMLCSFHELRDAADSTWLRVMKPPPAGFFFPYAVLDGGELQPHRSRGNLVWGLSRKIRLVAMVQDYRDILESYRRVRNKRQMTETLLVKMNQLVRSKGGNFTVILFDMTPEERADYRRFLVSQGIHFVDCDHPELHDRSLRLADGHPSGRLNELVAQWIEPVEAEGGQRAGR